MSCDGAVDDWYQGRDFCPISESLFRHIARANLVLSLALVAICLVLLRSLWKAGKKTTPLFRVAAGLVLNFGLLSLPMYTGRAFDAGSNGAIAVQPVFVAMWASGVSVWWYAAATYWFEVVLLSVMRFALALQPQKMKRWVSRCRRAVFAYTAFMTAVQVCTAVGLLVAQPPWRTRVIAFFNGGLSVGLLVMVLPVSFKALRELRLLLRSVLAEEGRCKLHEQLQVYFRAIAAVLCQLVITTLVTGLTACLPLLHRMGGFVFIYVLIPQLQACLCVIFGSHIYLVRRSRKAKVAHDSGDRARSPLAALTRKVPHVRFSLHEESVVQLVQEGVGVLVGCPSTQQVCVWNRGVSYRFLTKFTQDFQTSGLSTKEVCERVVVPATAGAHCSVWEAMYVVESAKMTAHKSSLATRGSLSRGSRLVRYTGTPTCFVSHAWQYGFDELVEIVGEYVKSLPEGRRDTCFFFVDVMSMNQHQMAEALSRAPGPDDPLRAPRTRTSSAHTVPHGDVHDMVLQNLTTSVTTAGKVLLALDTFHQPVALSRAWCLYEVYVAHSMRVPLSVGFGRSTARALTKHLRGGGEELVQEVLSNIDAGAAQATVEADREMILTLISGIGLEAFNTFIREKLRSALTALATSHWARQAGMFSLTASFRSLHVSLGRLSDVRLSAANMVGTCSFSKMGRGATVPMRASMSSIDMSTVASADTDGNSSVGLARDLAADGSPEDGGAACSSLRVGPEVYVSFCQQASPQESLVAAHGRGPHALPKRRMGSPDGAATPPAGRGFSPHALPVRRMGAPMFARPPLCAQDLPLVLECSSRS